MKKVISISLAVFAVLSVAMLLLLRYHFSQDADGAQETTSGCDYFNGEVLELTDEYLIVKPTEEWEGNAAVKVKIPLIQLREDDRGDEFSTTMPTRLYKGDISTLSPGERVRVAYNGETMEESGDEVLIKVVFMLYRLSNVKGHE